jgi:hypothetical protein
MKRIAQEKMQHTGGKICEIEREVPCATHILIEKGILNN